MYEVLEKSDVRQFTRSVMLQSADILRAVYPEEFTDADLKEHIDDLILRFRNKALRDTLFRVGHDLTRKLAFDDRFMGVIRLAVNYNKPYDRILKAMSYGLNFRAKDEQGNYYPSDSSFIKALAQDFESAVSVFLGINPEKGENVIEELKKQYELNKQSDPR